ncbi:hypothetical protein TNCV_1846881 [Trichonephila clavipes]|nr:hypothetical protein TNCV_1846881 [Trichonephila clavipes]
MKLVPSVVQSFRVAKAFSENSDRINSIDFSSDGVTLISSSDDDSIVIYDCERGVCMSRCPDQVDSLKQDLQCLSPSKLGTHLSTHCSMDERLSRPCPARE